MPAAPPAVPRDIQVRQLRAAAKLAEEKARTLASPASNCRVFSVVQKEGAVAG